ncbi:flagellin [Bacillus sp. CGMCC 1.16541]|uniref:flagellin N-terminal helical domain-containing protein n=1 Tax=Bacillus sp. CGMCC 1.16541 TaxID=2185143 RepID=UPI000D73744B|nr:flagellin [Bacillus sp. CGMCC 1.16541]
MRINHNIAALNTYRQLNSATGAQSKSMEKLSSGMRINRAGDDAAGLAISEKMRGQIRGLDMAAKNSQDGISLISTAEGALNETHAILQRMRELTVQSQNDTNTDDDRTALNMEYQQLSTEITRIGNNTEFNTQKLLNGSLSSSVANTGSDLTTANGIVGIKSNGAEVLTGYSIDIDTSAGTITLDNGAGKSETINYGGAPTGFDTKEVNFGSLGISVEINSSIADVSSNNTFDVTSTGSIDLQIGANSGQKMNIAISDMRSTALGGATKVSATSIDTKANANTALDVLDNAIKQVSDERAKLGSYQNRLEHTINNLSTSSENLTAAESRVRDVDYALAA